jgi:hypothetical protein
MKIQKLGRTILLSMLLALLTTGAAFASEGDPVEIVGTVIAIYPDDFTLEIEVDTDGLIEVFLVHVGQNFDFDTVDLGDLIEVKGTTNEDGSLVLTELKIQERARDRVKLQEGELESYFCTNEDQVHPVADKIAVTYGLDYSVIEGYLCGEPPVPLGQIILALQTAELTGGDYTEYLDGFEGISWGQVWQDLGLQGKPDHGTPPGQIKQQDGEGDPEEQIPPGQQKKEGEDLELEELIADWLPQGWFQKGKK